MENVNALKIRGFGTRTTRTMYFIPSWILLSILSNLAKYFNASSTEFEFTTSNMVPRIHITRLNRQLCLISCVLNKILTTKREIGWINSFLFWNKMNQNCIPFIPCNRCFISSLSCRYFGSMSGWSKAFADFSLMVPLLTGRWRLEIKANPFLPSWFAAKFCTVWKSVQS